MTTGPERTLIVETVRRFVDREVIPAAGPLEHAGEYPHALVGQMREMGLFGLNVPEEFGGAELDTVTLALVFEELSRGWLGLAGVLGTHSVLCDVLVRFRARRSEGALSARVSERRAAGRDLFVRGQRGHGPAGDLDDRGLAGRGVSRERREDVDY